MVLFSIVSFRSNLTHLIAYYLPQEAATAGRCNEAAAGRYGEAACRYNEAGGAMRSGGDGGQDDEVGGSI